MPLTKRTTLQNSSSSLLPGGILVKINSLENQFDLLYTMLDRIGDEVMLIGADGRIAYVNQATVKGIGHPRSYLLGRSVIQFHKHKMTFRSWKRTFLDTMRKNRKPIQFVLERVGKGGRQQTIDVTAALMSFQGKDYILSVARDITRQVLLQKELKESEELYRTVSEGAADCIFTVDLCGKITYVNESGTQLLKLPREKILGSHFRRYTDKKSLSRAFEIFRAACKGVSPIHEELEVVTGSGRRIPVDIHVTTLYKSGKIFQIHSLVRDISKRRELEVLQRQSERIQALTHFISGTVHQIKYPLLAVHASLQATLKTYAGRDFEYIGYTDFKSIMATIKSVSDKIYHCHEITERLLSISEKRLGLKKGACRINAIVGEAIRLIDERYLPANVLIRTKFSAYDPVVVISHVELSQIMVNILTNAVQAMPAGGVVTVKTFKDKARDKAVITVKDQGVGIKKEHLSRIFEPFFTTKQLGSEKSSGLGLSIVYAVVHAHQGRIDVKSDQREGTLVRIEFPLAAK